MSTFSNTILEHKYLYKEIGETSWEDVARRVAWEVVGKNYPKFYKPVFEAIKEKKFIPGGRYLYAAGRKYHQTQNCLLLDVEDTRQAWADLTRRVTEGLSTGAGIGVVYSKVRPNGSPILGMGGTATGPLALMQIINEVGRHIQQGGSRRSALWAGLHWNHADVLDFIDLKNWTPEVRELKAQDFNFPATMDGTNISVILDDAFFTAYDAGDTHARNVYWKVIKRMLKTGEPGFSIDVGVNAGEHLRNACVPAGTEILTKSGYVAIEDVLNNPVDVWNGFEWSTVTPKVTGKDQELVTVTLSSGRTLTCTNYHEFVVSLDYYGNSMRVKAKDLKPGMKLIKHAYPVIADGVDFAEAYTQGFISAEGMDDYTALYVYPPKYGVIDRLCVRNIRDEVNNNRKRTTVNFAKLPKSFVPFNWNLRSRLEWLAGLLDGDGTVLIEGGVQLSSVNYAFLLDVQKMLSTMGVDCKVRPSNKAGMRNMPNGKGGSAEYYCQATNRLIIGAVAVKNLVQLGMRCSRLEINHNPNRDASQFVTVVDVESAGTADTVYCFDEPLRHLGCFDGVVTGQCTEVSSKDDNDICNLGSINLGKIETKEDFAQIVELATVFLLCGTLYSKLPFEEVGAVREKNRRLGLGLMGLHEWLLLRGKRYGRDTELSEWLEVYATSTDIAAKYADELKISRPVKTRAIAPTGTLSIIAETTAGIEPIFCTAFKRRYLKGNTWHYQYVIDATAQRIIDRGVNPDSIEDAYSLANDVERRVQFQAFVQQYVDHGISSTINLPAWGSDYNGEHTVEPFGDMLMKYLPQLRGITTYPDAARGGQPLTAVPYLEAKNGVGVEHLEYGNEASCVSGVCGI
jgi:ribonucleotide reductase alpha subunit